MLRAMASKLMRVEERSTGCRKLQRQEGKQEAGLQGELAGMRTANEAEDSGETKEGCHVGQL